MADQKQFNGTVTFNGATSAVGTFNHIKDPISALSGVTTTLTKEQSGGAVVIFPNAAIVVLPSVSTAGQYFEFVMGGNGSTAECTVKTATSDNSEFFVGGFATGEGVSHEIKSDGNSNSEVNFHATNSKAGDRFSCISNGTAWMITSGYCPHSTGMAFADQ